MKESIYKEKWAKSWLKNRVSVTLGILVALMISGGVAYGTEKIPQDNEITEELLKEISDLKDEIKFLKGKVKKVSGKESIDSVTELHRSIERKLIALRSEIPVTMGKSGEKSKNYLSVNCTGNQPTNEAKDSVAIGSVYIHSDNKNNVGIGYQAYLTGDGTVGIGSPYINSQPKIAGGTEFYPVTVIGYMNSIGAESIGIGNEMEFNGKDNIAFGTYLYEGYSVDTPKYWEDEEHIAVPIASHTGERGLGGGPGGDRNIVFGNKICLNNKSEHPVENAIVIGNITKIPDNMQQMGDDHHMFRAMPQKISTLSEGTTDWVPVDPEEDPVPVDPVPVDPDLEVDDYYIGIENDVIAIGKMSSSFAKKSIRIGNETRSGVGVALGNNARALGAIEYTPSGTYEKEFLGGHSLALGNDSYVNIKNSLSLGYNSEIKRDFTIGELPDSGELPDPEELPDPGELPEMGEFPDPGEFPHPGESPDPGGSPEPEEEDWKTTGYLLKEENNDGKNGVISVGKGVLKEDPIPVKSVTLGAAETAEETVTTPEKAINRRIINIADGAYDYDLITIRQLKKLEKDLGLTPEEAQLYLKYAGNKYAPGVNPDDAKIDMEEGTLTIKGVTPGKNPNIVTTAQANGVVELELGDTLNIGDGANMVTVGGNEIKNSKVTINNTGINGGGEKIVNVAAAVNDNEAINYKQMDDRLKDVVVSSGGTPVDIKGTGAAVVTKNTENVYNIHVDKLIQYVDKNGDSVVRDGDNFYIFKDGEIDRTKLVAKNDVEVKLIDPYGKTVVPVKFGNVADGKIAPDSTDLINGGQLYEALRPFRDHSNAIAANTQGIKDLKRDHKNGIAQMSAMSAVDFTRMRAEKLKVGVGVGCYKGARAIAVGFAYAPTDYFLLDAKWSSPTNTHRGGAVGIGMTYEFNCN